MTRLTLIPVQPTGERTVRAMIHGRVESVTEFVYPPSANGQRLRHERVEVEPYLSIRVAARKAGLTASQVSALEQGEATLSELDWRELFKRLRCTCGDFGIQACPTSAGGSHP